MLGAEGGVRRWVLGADGDVRQCSFRMATKRGRTDVVSFKTVVLRLRVSNSGRRFDVPTKPSIVFFKTANPSWLLVKTHKHNPSRLFAHIGHDRLVRDRRLL